MAEISNDKLMEVLLDIKGSVGKVEGTVSAMATSIGDEKLRSRANEFGMDERMRKVENKVHAWSFAGGLLGVMAGWLGMHIK